MKNTNNKGKGIEKFVSCEYSKVYSLFGIEFGGCSHKYFPVAHPITYLGNLMDRLAHPTITEVLPKDKIYEPSKVCGRCPVYSKQKELKGGKN